MAKIGHLQAFYLSIFNLSSYTWLRKQAVGRAMTYLVLLAVFLVLLQVVYLGITVAPRAVRQMDDFVEWLTVRMPEITVTAEGAFSPVKEPIVDVYPPFDLKLVIDTTRDLDLITQHPDARIILARDAIFFRVNPRETRTFEFAEIARESGVPEGEEGYILITPERVRLQYGRIKLWAMPLIVIFVFIWILAVLIVQALIFSLVALVINLFRAAEERFSYGPLLALSCYSITAMNVLGTLRSMFRIPVPFFGILLTALTVFYVWNGVMRSEAQVFESGREESGGE